METKVEKKRIKAESLAYWYFRLNGFLATVNFVIHPDIGSNQRTDVDILGVRFPYRAELLRNPMPDDSLVSQIKDRPYVVIAEVKKGQCELNGPWVKPEEENLPRVLRAVGITPLESITKAAQALYERGHWEDSTCRISLFCVGGERSETIKVRYPDVPQLVWNDVLKFIFDRFKGFREQKVSHRQWDSNGKMLWNLADSCSDVSQFIQRITVTA